MNKNDYIIRLEEKRDFRAVENLVRESFWNVYKPGCAEHYVIHVLRDDPAFIPELDFVMERDGNLIGQNMFMKTTIEADDGRVIDILTMGTIGITPDRPETGYGYIEADLSATSARNKEIYRVDSFKEKPDLATAEKYVKKNNYLWNAGIFVWNVSTIVNAMRVYQPAISDIFENLLPYYGTPRQQEMINQEFPKCENISVDYAILEKAEEIFVFPASFGWSDLGTWGSLHGQSKHDTSNNVCIGSDIRLFETKNCLIHTTQEKKVVVQGLDGYIIAEKDNTLLICQLCEEQRIKQFSE